MTAEHDPRKTAFTRAVELISIEVGADAISEPERPRFILEGRGAAFGEGGLTATEGSELIAALAIIAGVLLRRAALPILDDDAYESVVAERDDMLMLLDSIDRAIDDELDRS